MVSVVPRTRLCLVAAQQFIIIIFFFCHEYKVHFYDANLCGLHWAASIHCSHHYTDVSLINERKR